VDQEEQAALVQVLVDVYSAVAVLMGACSKSFRRKDIYNMLAKKGRLLDVLGWHAMASVFFKLRLRQGGNQTCSAGSLYSLL